MRDHSVLVLDSRTGSLAFSWLASCLLHGGIAVAAIFFLQRMQLAPQADPFQWDVAMVATLSPSMGFTSSTKSMAPPTPAPRRPNPPTTESHPAVPPVQPRVITPVTPPPSAPIAEFSSEPRPEQLLAPILAPSNQTLPQPLHTESRQQDDALSAVAPSPSHVESQTSTDSLLNSSTSVIAPSAPATQLTSAKMDYGWLSELMARWIEDLNKRYPAMLRTEGIQGKVTLTALLHEDGLLSDVRVAKSSGNVALDQVALEDVKNGPPIKLSHPLERSQMWVKFSIVYDLKTAR